MTSPIYRPRLQRRLMLAFTGYALGVSALFGLLAMLFVYAVEDEFFASALRQELQRQQAHHAKHRNWTAPTQDFIRIYHPGAALPADLARARATQPHQRELAGDAGRHYHLLPLDSDGTLLVAEVGSQLVVRPMRQRLLAWLAAWGGAVTVLALALGAWLAWRSSAPLARLAARVAQSQPDQLPLDLAEPSRHEDEVGRLARHLAELNQRTRDLIAREQAFTRDASHELRTPLTVLGIACETLQCDATPQQQAVLATMDAAIRQLQQTVELLLALARESSTRTDAQERPLLPQVEQVVLAHAPLLDREGVVLDIAVAPTLTRRWPLALTQLLLANLLANALSHRGSPHIRIAADAQRLTFANASAPPPPALLQTGAGLEAGLKGEASAGLGLGLSIVRRLAERHGLRLELNHEEGLTTVSLIG